MDRGLLEPYNSSYRSGPIGHLYLLVADVAVTYSKKVLIGERNMIDPLEKEDEQIEPKEAPEQIEPKKAPEHSYTEKDAEKGQKWEDIADGDYARRAKCDSDHPLDD